MRRGYFFLALVMLLGIFIYLAPLYFKGSLLDPNAGVLNWGLVATIFVSLTVLGFFFEFERAAAGAKEIVLCSGYVFGPLAGFMIACLTALISNFFLGQGPWTPYI